MRSLRWTAISTLRGAKSGTKSSSGTQQMKVIRGAWEWETFRKAVKVIGRQ